MNILDALDLFLTQLDADGRSPHTVAQYARHVRTFDRWLVAERRSSALEAVTHETVAAFFASPAARCRSTDSRLTKRPTSQNAMRTSMRCFLSYAHDVGWIPTNPARRLRRALCGQPVPRALSMGDRKRLFSALAEANDASGKRDHVLFHLLVATGMRVSAGLSLRIEDIDFDAGELSVRSSKGSRPARVFLNPEIIEHLRRHLGARTEGFVFEGSSGRPMDRRHAHRRLRTWLHKASISKAGGPHVLRHTFATDLYSRTGDLYLVKAALHHASISSTTIYATISASAVRDAICAARCV
jgi:site-specific recombinase XerD